MVTTVAMDNLVVFFDGHVDCDEVNAILSRLEKEIHTVFEVEVVAFLGIRDDESELLVEILEDFLMCGVLLQLIEFDNSLFTTHFNCYVYVILTINS